MELEAEAIDELTCRIYVSNNRVTNKHVVVVTFDSSPSPQAYL